MATATATTDHDEIRSWVEARGGHPARVKSTGSRNDPGVLRIDFPGFSGEDTLEEIEWDEFFEWFDRNDLALLLSDEEGNRFNKLVSRETAAPSRSAAASSRKRAASSGKKASSSAKRTSGAKRTAGTKGTSAKKAASSAKKSSARKAGAKKASSSTKRTSTKKASSSAKKGSAKKASSSAKKGGAKKASSSTKKASSAKKSASTRRVVASSTAKKGSAKKASSSAKKASAKKASSSKKAGGNITTDHDEIRRWVEARGGFPAHVRQTGRKRGDLGVLRIDYPGYSGKDTLERVDWEDWFAAFDRNRLAFLHDNKRNSRFSKLVNR